jgi:hypothetical protein
LWSWRRRNRRSNRGSWPDQCWSRRRRRCRCRRNGRRRSCRTHPGSLGGGFLGFYVHLSFGFRLGFRLGFRFSLSQQIFANFFGDIFRNRARVRLLLGYSIPRQQVNDGFRLDLQFTRQLVNSDLVYVSHASYRPFPVTHLIAASIPRAICCLRLRLFL